MIRILTGDKTIEAANVTELKDKIGDIFQEDPNSDVLLTYVVTTQPASRRMAPTT